MLETYDLLPGDICYFGNRDKSGSEIVCPADMLLLSGNCIVNEAMLTGESTPRLKVCFFF